MRPPSFPRPLPPSDSRVRRRRRATPQRPTASGSPSQARSSERLSFARRPGWPGHFPEPPRLAKQSPPARDRFPEPGHPARSTKDSPGPGRSPILSGFPALARSPASPRSPKRQARPARVTRLRNSPPTRAPRLKTRRRRPAQPLRRRLRARSPNRPLHPLSHLRRPQQPRQLQGLPRPRYFPHLQRPRRPQGLSRPQRPQRIPQAQQQAAPARQRPLRPRSETSRRLPRRPRSPLPAPFCGPLPPPLGTPEDRPRRRCLLAEPTPARDRRRPPTLRRRRARARRCRAASLRVRLSPDRPLLSRVRR